MLLSNENACTRVRVRTGELLDQIEYQVKGAANYVEQGTQQVQGAIQNAKKARKYQCCMLVCVLILVGVLVLVLFVFKKSR